MSVRVLHSIYYLNKCLLSSTPIIFLITKSSPVTFLPFNVQMQNPECSVMVDNCYGELVESIEPPMVVCDNVLQYVLLYSKDVQYHISTLIGRVQI